MDAVQDQQAVDARPLGAGNIGAQGIAHPQDATAVGGGEKLEAGIIDRPVRLAEVMHLAAQLLVAQRHGAGADLRLAGMDHHQIGIGADHGQAAADSRDQRRLEILDLVRGTLHPGVENEIRLLDAPHHLDGEALQHVVVTCRHDGIEAFAEMPAIAGKPIPGRLAGGEQRVIEPGPDADLGDAPDDGRRPARRVGEDDDPLARGMQPLKRIDGAWQRVLAVMKHAPEIEDEALIAIGQCCDAGEQRNGHGFLVAWSMPTASARRAKPSALSRAAKPRLIRSTSPGP